MICKICTQTSETFGTTTVLGKYPVRYYKCSQCGFVQTEEPYWLDEAYDKAITASDVGLVSRNLGCTITSTAMIGAFFDRDACFLDYGGGYGLLVRLMRDMGYKFYLYDAFCPNLFAIGHEADAQRCGQYELVTAFEVFEHLVQPLVEIRQMLEFSKSLLFSTFLIPVSNPKLTEWWYYGLDHGQHVALYSRRTLEFIAHQFGLNLYSNGRQLHLLTPKRLPNVAFQLLAHQKTALAAAFIFRRASLRPDDYFSLTGKLST